MSWIEVIVLEAPAYVPPANTMRSRGQWTTSSAKGQHLTNGQEPCNTQISPCTVGQAAHVFVSLLEINFYVWWSTDRSGLRWRQRAVT